MWAKSCLALALLLSLPVAAQAQRARVDDLPSHVIVDSCSGCGGGSSTDIVASGVMALAGDSVTLTFTQPVATVGVYIGFPFAGQMSFFATIDGTNWAATYCHQVGQFTASELSRAGAGPLTCSAAGFVGFRVEATTLTFGTPTVTIRGSIGARTEADDLYLSAIYQQLFSTLTVSVAGSVEVTQGTGSNLHIVCDSGCGSPVATPDASAFTATVTGVVTTASVYDDSLAGLPAGVFGATRMTQFRGMHVNLRTEAGIEVPATDNSHFFVNTGGLVPIAAIVDDTATSAVAEDAVGVPRMTANRVLYADLSQTTANATAIKVDGSAVTQPVSGTITTTPPSNASTNVVQWNGNTVALNSGAATAGTLRIAPANDKPFLAGITSLTTGNTVSIPVANTSLVGTETGVIVRTIAMANASENIAQLAGTTTATNTGNASAGTLRVVLATDQPALTNKLLVTPDSVALPANQSVNVAQLAGTTTDTNSGSKSAGTLRVVLATDQPALTNKLLVTPDSVALPANQSVNVNQLAGTATDTNSGVKSAGTLRVVLATDQPALTNKLLVTPDSVALPANQSVNVNQIGGNAVSTAASGTQKVGITGNAGAAVDAANNAAMPANAVTVGVQTATIDTSPTAATAGNMRYQLASTEGVVYVQEGGPKRFSCVIQAATVTTQCQAAPAAGLRAYVTSVTMSNQAATVQTLDVVFGTGAACVTAITALTHKVQFGTNATTTSPQSYGMQFQTPLVPTAANAICVRPSAATAFGATITGYIAP